MARRTNADLSAAQKARGYKKYMTGSILDLDKKEQIIEIKISKPIIYQIYYILSGFEAKPSLLMKISDNFSIDDSYFIFNLYMPCVKMYTKVLRNNVTNSITGKEKYFKNEEALIEIKFPIKSKIGIAIKKEILYYLKHKIDQYQSLDPEDLETPTALYATFNIYIYNLLENCYSDYTILNIYKHRTLNPHEEANKEKVKKHFHIYGKQGIYNKPFKASDIVVLINAKTKE